MKTEIDGKLLDEVRKLAERQRRSEKEVLDEAVKKYLERNRKGGIEDLFERIDRGQRERGVEPLSEEEAQRIAYEELHAMRRERKATT